jgi:4-hydroxy-3-polyprenylbenzoate decarboxylase
MIVAAISGASGPIMGIRLIEELLNMETEVCSVVSKSAIQIIKHEMSYDMEASSSLKPLLEKRGISTNLDLLKEFDSHNFFSPPASGSSEFEAVVVMPCSMKTLSAIANGYSDCLITRSCDVALKEKRRCIIVPRESPLNIIHIENMKKAALAGVDIVPPVPGFYTLPKTVDDIVNFPVGKVLNLLGKKHTLFKSWSDLSRS